MQYISDKHGRIRRHHWHIRCHTRQDRRFVVGRLRVRGVSEQHTRWLCCTRRSCLPRPPSHSHHNIHRRKPTAHQVVYNDDCKRLRQIVESTVAASQLKWCVQQLKEHRLAAKTGIVFPVLSLPQYYTTDSQIFSDYIPCELVKVNLVTSCCLL